MLRGPSFEMPQPGVEVIGQVGNCVGDGIEDVVSVPEVLADLEPIALAASACSSLIETGCVALRITFDESGEDQMVEFRRTAAQRSASTST